MRCSLQHQSDYSQTDSRTTTHITVHVRDHHLLLLTGASHNGVQPTRGRRMMQRKSQIRHCLCNDVLTTIMCNEVMTTFMSNDVH